MPGFLAVCKRCLLAHLCAFRCGCAQHKTPLPPHILFVVSAPCNVCTWRRICRSNALLTLSRLEDGRSKVAVRNQRRRFLMCCSRKPLGLISAAARFDFGALELTHHLQGTSCVTCSIERRHWCKYSVYCAFYFHAPVLKVTPHCKNWEGKKMVMLVMFPWGEAFPSGYWRGHVAITAS